MNRKAIRDLAAKELGLKLQLPIRNLSNRIAKAKKL
jgi:hypothetical protein